MTPRNGFHGHPAEAESVTVLQAPPVAYSATAGPRNSTPRCGLPKGLASGWPGVMS